MSFRPATQDLLPEETSQQLGRRVWLLLPLALFSLLGIGVPLTGKGTPEAGFMESGPPTPREARMPYEDDLLPLLRRPGLDPKALAVLSHFHAKLQQEAAAHHGTIQASERSLVERYLDLYR